MGSTLVASPTYEPQHYKTNKMTCAPSEEPDQPGYPPSQWVAEDPMFLHADSEDSESSLGAEVILLFWLYSSSYKSEPCSKKVLNAVSLQCTRGKSSVARKTEVDPKLFKR